MDVYELLRYEDIDDGAMSLDMKEYEVILDFYKRFMKTYKKFACEMYISIEPYLTNMSQDEYEEIVTEYGNILKRLIRNSDIIVKTDYGFNILLPEMDDEKMVMVTDRIKEKIRSMELCYMVKVSIDSHIIGCEGEYPLWYKAAV